MKNFLIKKIRTTFNASNPTHSSVGSSISKNTAGSTTNDDAIDLAINEMDKTLEYNDDGLIENPFTLLIRIKEHLDNYIETDGFNEEKALECQLKLLDLIIDGTAYDDFGMFMCDLFDDSKDVILKKIRLQHTRKNFLKILNIYQNINENHKNDIDILGCLLKLYISQEEYLIPYFLFIKHDELAKIYVEDYNNVLHQVKCSDKINYFFRGNPCKEDLDSINIFILGMEEHDPEFIRKNSIEIRALMNGYLNLYKDEFIESHRIADVIDVLVKRDVLTDDELVKICEVFSEFNMLNKLSKTLREFFLPRLSLDCIDSRIGAILDSTNLSGEFLKQCSDDDVLKFYQKSVIKNLLGVTILPSIDRENHHFFRRLLELQLTRQFIDIGTLFLLAYQNRGYLLDDDNLLCRCLIASLKSHKQDNLRELHIGITPEKCKELIEELIEGNKIDEARDLNSLLGKMYTGKIIKFRQIDDKREFKYRKAIGEISEKYKLPLYDQDQITTDIPSPVETPPLPLKAPLDEKSKSDRKRVSFSSEIDFHSPGVVHKELELWSDINEIIEYETNNDGDKVDNEIQEDDSTHKTENEMLRSKTKNYLEIIHGKTGRWLVSLDKVSKASSVELKKILPALKKMSRQLSSSVLRYIPRIEFIERREGTGCIPGVPGMHLVKPKISSKTKNIVSSEIQKDGGAKKDETEILRSKIENYLRIVHGKTGKWLINLDNVSTATMVDLKKMLSALKKQGKRLSPVLRYIPRIEFIERKEGAGCIPEVPGVRFIKPRIVSKSKCSKF